MFTAIKLLVVAAIWFKKIHSSIPKLYFELCYCSIHNLESLEDWDNICGENFSLEQEDFGSLDERLTSAFQHLILPSDWNLLGDPATGCP